MIGDYDTYEIGRSQSEDAIGDCRVSYILLHLHKHVYLNALQSKKRKIKKGLEENFAMCLNN